MSSTITLTVPVPVSGGDPEEKKNRRKIKIFSLDCIYFQFLELEVKTCKM